MVAHLSPLQPLGGLTQTFYDTDYLKQSQYSLPTAYVYNRATDYTTNWATGTPTSHGTTYQTGGYGTSHNTYHSTRYIGNKNTDYQTTGNTSAKTVWSYYNKTTSGNKVYGAWSLENRQTWAVNSGWNSGNKATGYYSYYVANMNFSVPSGGSGKYTVSVVRNSGAAEAPTGNLIKPTKAWISYSIHKGGWLEFHRKNSIYLNSNHYGKCIVRADGGDYNNSTLSNAITSYDINFNNTNTILISTYNHNTTKNARLQNWNGTKNIYRYMRTYIFEKGNLVGPVSGNDFTRSGYEISTPVMYNCTCKWYPSYTLDIQAVFDGTVLADLMKEAGNNLLADAPNQMFTRNITGHYSSNTYRYGLSWFPPSTGFNGWVGVNIFGATPNNWYGGPTQNFNGAPPQNLSPEDLGDNNVYWIRFDRPPTNSAINTDRRQSVSTTKDTYYAQLNYTTTTNFWNTQHNSYYTYNVWSNWNTTYGNYNINYSWPTFNTKKVTTSTSYPNTNYKTNYLTKKPTTYISSYVSGFNTDNSTKYNTVDIQTKNTTYETTVASAVQTDHFTG